VITSGWRGPGWRVIDADPDQVRPVRDWIRAAINRHDSPVDPDEAALVISELYTNSVMHGPEGSRVLVGYCLWSAGARIVVCDAGGLTAPHVRRDAGLAEGGRGLQVIHAIAAQWDSFCLPGARVVWCDLGQPLRAPAADAWAWLHRVLAVCPLTAGTTCCLPAPPAPAGVR
jgi:anti-sigma regulatory factor (Ser/Thr protein kinase)